MKDICFVSLGVQYCMIWPRHGICSIMHRDNLTKRNWKGDSKCCFCVIRKKTYNICSLIARWQSLPGMLFSFLLESFHLLVYHICWVLGWMVFPWSLENKYNVVYFKKRKQMLVGAAAICWALWSSRNDAVFSQKFPNSYLQVIFRETHWTRYWSQLFKVGNFLFLFEEGFLFLASLKHMTDSFTNFSWWDRDGRSS